jgi:hypothetical protein
VRSSSAVTSATYADATLTFAAKAPPNTRAAKIHGSELASPSASSESAVPATVISKTGRRPMRSERRPQSGANTNCAAAWHIKSNPSTVALAPNSLA